jgi:hypothetical protein
MFDSNFSPYDAIRQLETRVKGLELIVQKLVTQMGDHSQHIAVIGDQGVHVASALTGLHNQTQILNSRLTRVENAPLGK